MSKTHLLSSPDPLLPGQDQVASCGVTVPKAEFPFFFDTEEFTGKAGPNRASTMLFCRECLMESTRGHRYWYLLLPGQEMRDEEAA